MSNVENLMGLHTEAAGVVTLQVVRVSDAFELLGRASAGDKEAVRLLNAVNDAVMRISAAPPNDPMLCATCPRSLPGTRHSFVVVLPACDDPTHALAMAVCVRCATSAEQIKQKSIDALRNLWPDLRSISINPEGGHA